MGKDTNNLFIFCLVVFGLLWFLYHKYIQARQRVRNVRNIGNRHPRPNNNIATVVNHTKKNPKELKKTAKFRYLSDDSWKNQCIVLCGHQLVNIIEINNEFTIEFNNGIIDLLSRLAKRHRLYILFHLRNGLPYDNNKPNEMGPFEKYFINECEKAGICQFIEKHKILFCTTHKGKSAMVRQLNPTLYFDSDTIVLKELYRFIPEIVQISPLIDLGSIEPSVGIARNIVEYLS